MPARSTGANERLANVAPRSPPLTSVASDAIQEAPMLDRTQEATLQRSRLRARYDNFIGGRWQAPVKGRYFTDTSPIDGSKLCDVARSDAEDVERALDAAHAARDAWG